MKYSFQNDMVDTIRQVWRGEVEKIANEELAKAHEAMRQRVLALAADMSVRVTSLVDHYRDPYTQKIDITFHIPGLASEMPIASNPSPSEPPTHTNSHK
jgi:hypothetical protein